MKRDFGELKGFGRAESGRSKDRPLHLCDGGANQAETLRDEVEFAAALAVAAGATGVLLAALVDEEAAGVDDAEAGL